MEIKLLFFSVAFVYLFSKFLFVKKYGRHKPFGSRCIVDDNRLFFSQSYLLRGKPDLVYEKQNKLYVYELKSAPNHTDAPYRGDLFQLASYFLLLEEEFPQKKIPHGKIIYQNRVFLIKNSKKLRLELIQLMAEMRTALETNCPPVIEKDFVKCKHCLVHDTLCS